MSVYSGIGRFLSMGLLGIGGWDGITADACDQNIWIKRHIFQSPPVALRHSIAAL
jgi:hypothetical protein